MKKGTLAGSVERSPQPVAPPRRTAATTGKAKPSTAAEVRRLLALADKLINTAHALQKEAALKLRNAQRS